MSQKQFLKIYHTLVYFGSPIHQALKSRFNRSPAYAIFYFTTFCIGVEGADILTLSQFSTRPPVQLSGLKFRELFIWLSQSAKGASKAAQGSTVQLPPPTGWATVSV